MVSCHEKSSRCYPRGHVTTLFGSQRHQQCIQSRIFECLLQTKQCFLKSILTLSKGTRHLFSVLNKCELPLSRNGPKYLAKHGCVSAQQGLTQAFRVAETSLCCHFRSFWTIGTIFYLGYYPVKIKPTKIYRKMSPIPPSKLQFCPFFALFYPERPNSQSQK